MKKALLFVVALTLIGTKATAQQYFKQGTPSQYIYKVLDYSPAPGQFVNTSPAYEKGDDAAKMAQKCTDMLANNKRDLITLGAFGGSVTFHFDHSVANIAGKKDFAIEGNAFQNNSEPGIVMVSKDVNRNGIADDPWYELRGSADDEKPNRVVAVKWREITTMHKSIIPCGCQLKLPIRAAFYLRMPRKSQVQPSGNCMNLPTDT